MSDKHLTETSVFDATEVRETRIREILESVDSALKDRGYNAVNQIAGYLISNDPAYISSHNNARVLVQEVDRFDIIEELVRFYLQSK